MRKTVFIGALFFIVILAVTALGATATRRAAVVRFMKPTIVAGAAVMGPVVFEHDVSSRYRPWPGSHASRSYFLAADAPRNSPRAITSNPRFSMISTTAPASPAKRFSGPWPRSSRSSPLPPR